MAGNYTASSLGEIDLHATSWPRSVMARLFPPATRTELWAGLALVVLSVLGAVWVVKCRSNALALEQNSRTVAGNVVRLWMTEAKKGWRYHVEYEYIAPSEVVLHPLRNEAELPKDYFERLREGGSIAVQVCRSDPANHQVVGAHPPVFSSASATFVYLSILTLLALSGTINLWWWWVSHRGPRRAQVWILRLKDVS